MIWAAVAIFISCLASFVVGGIFQSQENGSNLAKDALNLVGKSKAEVQDKLGQPFETYSMADFEGNERPRYREHRDRMPDMDYDEIHRYRQGGLYVYIYFKGNRVVNFYAHGT